MSSDNLVDYTLQIAPPRLTQSDIGRRLVASLIGVPAETTAIMKREAAMCQQQDQLLTPRNSEQRSLEDRGFFQYLNEDRTAMKARVQNSWKDWQSMGFEHGIEKQLEYAGWPNSKLISTGLHGTTTYPFVGEGYQGNGPYSTDDEEWQTYPASSSYWSQFIVVIPVTDYSRWTQWVTATEWDLDYVNWDSGFYWDNVQSYTVSQTVLVEMKKIINTYKPVDHICREIILLPPVVAAMWNNGDFATNPESVISVDLGWKVNERWNPIY